METIGEQKLWSFVPSNRHAARVASCTIIRKAEGHRVGSFMELATKVAELQFMNREHVLLFRGQKSDHKNVQNNTSLKPSLFRAEGERNPSPSTLIARFEKLRRAEFILTQEFARLRLLGVDRIKRQQILRWAILQHYEVCATPLLDVTHSLRIAASFASDMADSKAFIFVLGVPNLSGAVTASAEANIQTIRLSSVCPPTAARPHLQEGYLLGEYPEMAGYDQKQNYAHYEIDFGRRLVAKFYFNPRKFWQDDTFPMVERSALYPNDRDSFYEVAERIKQTLERR